MNAANTSNLESVIFYGLIIAGAIIGAGAFLGCALIALALFKRK